MDQYQIGNYKVQQNVHKDIKWHKKMECRHYQNQNT